MHTSNTIAQTRQHTTFEHAMNKIKLIQRMFDKFLGVNSEMRRYDNNLQTKTRASGYHVRNRKQTNVLKRKQTKLERQETRSVAQKQHKNQTNMSKITNWNHPSRPRTTKQKKPNTRFLIIPTLMSMQKWKNVRLQAAAGTYRHSLKPIARVIQN